MSQDYRNVLYIWDLERSDSLLHARAFIAGISSAAKARAFVGTGRYAALLQNEFEPTEFVAEPFTDIQSLEASLRIMLQESEAQSGLDVYVQGLPDTIRMIESVLTAYQGPSLPIRVSFQPQQDGSRLG